MASSTLRHTQNMDFSASAGQFSDELTKLLITPSHTGNALISPLSLLTALSMLLAGSRGPTKGSLTSTLQLPSNVSQDDVDSYFNTLISAYNSRANDRNKLLIKNKMLVSGETVKDQPLLPSFEETVRNKYDASVESVDFVNKGLEVKNQVNSWVNESTNGLIQSLLDDPPKADTVFMLLNAVYFESKWAKVFKSPYEREFYVDGSTEKNVTFMSRTSRLKYSEIAGPDGAKVQALAIPYESGHSMIILLPPASVSVNSLFDEKKISSMARQVAAVTSQREIDLHMPKFKFDTKLSMKSYLTSMGARDLFLAPDLSGINGASNLKVTDVKHATAIEVDQEGTKAAAVTSIEISLTSLVIGKEEPLQVVLDRPFAFVIYDTTNQLPIFVGKLSDPNSP